MTQELTIMAQTGTAAERNREDLREAHVLAIALVGPPGAGTFSHGGLRSRNGRPSATRVPPGLARDRVT